MVFFRDMFIDGSANWPGNVLESVNQFNELVKNSALGTTSRGKRVKRNTARLRSGTTGKKSEV